MNLYKLLGIALIAWSASFMTLFIVKALRPCPPVPETHSCRPPHDQGERLIVTLEMRDGVLSEHCAYHPTTTPRGGNNLKSWKGE